jgi:glyoxylase-like metal-dependent hydrolase (beta-lactamase superfamily II)
MSELQIKKFELGELATNAYIVWCTETNTAIIIDPADSGDVLSECLLENNLELQAIILTHGHFDHCLGLLELSLNFAVPTYIHQKDVALISGAQKSAEHWLKHSVDPVPVPTDRFSENDTVSFGQWAIKVIETPGHSPGSVCLHVVAENESAQSAPIFIDGLQILPGTSPLFTGDTVFKDSYPRTDFKYSSVLELSKSWEKLRQLPAETTILPGHGDITRLGATAVFKKN